MKIRQAVILAGGRGSRLKPITNTIPKPMAPVNGLPFLDYQIKSIIDSGIEEILILCGYKGNLIIDRYKDTKEIKIDFSLGHESDKTGRRLLNAYSKLKDYFLLLYGDNYWSIELKKIIKNYKKLNLGITTTVFSNKLGTSEYGFDNNIIVDKSGMVLGYDKSRSNSKANGVDIGYFVIDKSKLDRTINQNISFEVDLIPKFISSKQFGAYVTDNQYHYITDYESLKDFEKEVEINKLKAIYI